MLPVHRLSSMPNDYNDDKYRKHGRHWSIKMFLSGLWTRRRSGVLICLFLSFLAIYTLLVHDRPLSDEVLDTKAVTDEYQAPPPLAPPIDDNRPNEIVIQDGSSTSDDRSGNNDSNRDENISEGKDDTSDTSFLFTQIPPPKQLKPADDKETAYRQEQVVEAYRHAWKGYVQDAFGMDEYEPLTHQGRDWAPGGLGLMIVDALDTMLLMNLTEEYTMAREWVATKLDFDKDQNVNVFETTIRVLGGLLSAYHLSGNDPVYLDKATDLGNRLLGAFQTESGIPYASVVLSTGLPFTFHVPSSTAEVATIQLEFKYLSHLTGDPKYWTAAERVMVKLKQLVDQGHTVDGLVPILIHPQTGMFNTREIRLGSRGDSYYEYLIKQYLQTEKTEPIYLDMYRQTVHAIQKHLMSRSHPNNLLYIGELLNGVPGTVHPKMDHLVCFIGGSFALGATQGLTLAQAPLMTDEDRDDLQMGKEITRTCWEMYSSTATGLASEIVYFNTNSNNQGGNGNDIFIQPRDRHNLLRPETVESLFILWRITGDPIYREWGWQIFESFEKYTKLPNGGYAALKDVTQIPPPQDDRMDTFFLAETLKYLYLLFSPDDFIPLDKYVFNSEAHPLPMFQPGNNR
ncbi:glycoside hydrolase [Zychaea mexicana]|uniref:glycoside hydrolase n=1 Tax=Zychaea mexicana TaxID=64656 RepID=UPI0022FDBF87|nr:glycoside hydrolase [Zychaea mexicana]KAI9498956.1 glycoside hydrolase [Zychaea mexicana]